VLGVHQRDRDRAVEPGGVLQDEAAHELPIAHALDDHAADGAVRSGQARLGEERVLHVQTAARHPRNNRDWPLVGIFAQRGKNRPNRLGVSRCAIERVEGLDIHVSGLDAIDGTPVLDIKPYMAEFAPAGETRQPEWATELMRNYY